MLTSVRKPNDDAVTQLWRLQTQPMYSLPESGRGYPNVWISWPWKKRRPLDNTGLVEARQMRVQAQHALDNAVARQKKEEKTVIQPLLRVREDMLQHNHVYDELVRLLREGR